MGTKILPIKILNNCFPATVSDAVKITNSKENIKQYTVTFYDEDNTTVLGTSTVNYGDNASYNGDTSTLDSAKEYADGLITWVNW